MKKIWILTIFLVVCLALIIVGTIGDKNYKSNEEHIEESSTYINYSNYWDSEKEVVQESCIKIGMNYNEYFKCTGKNVSEMDFIAKSDVVYYMQGQSTPWDTNDYYKIEGEEINIITVDEYMEGIRK